MTKAATIRKGDLRRYAEIATEKGCRVVIQLGDTVVTVEPDRKKNEEAGIDYSGPVL